MYKSMYPFISPTCQPIKEKKNGGRTIHFLGNKCILLVKQPIIYICLWQKEAMV